MLREENGLRILNVGREGNLLQTRAAILRGQGFRVENATSAEEAVVRCRQELFDAVVIGHTLEREEQEAVIRWARRRKPTPRIIVLYRISPKEAEGAHLAIDSHDTPEALIEALRRLDHPRRRRP